MIYSFIRNRIAKTKLFWKYRHIIQPDVWKSYINDSDNIRRNFYSDFMKANKLTSIFEYGCGSAPNFLAVKSKLDLFYYYGYDISKEAINIAHKNYGNNIFHFTANDKLKLMESYLKQNNLNKFDLTIFDRVLYMISENDLNNLLNKYSYILSYIIIDDFYSETPQWDKEKYIYSKNYVKIFSNYGFELIDIKNSQIHSSTAQKFAKILVLKKIIK
jgi:SAM-dependent methyltransferase